MHSPRARSRAVRLLLLLSLFASASRAATLDRPPQILEARQAGPSVRLLWSLGGDADGTLDADVESYTVRRKIGDGPWQDVLTFDDRTMTFEELIASLTAEPQLESWWNQHPLVRYQVYATTRAPDVSTTFSDEVVVDAALPLWIQEVHGGAARLAWIDSKAPAGYPVHLGYVVQKRSASGWVDQTGFVRSRSYVDPHTQSGSPSVYRVLTAYQSAAGELQDWRASNVQAITIQPMCAGQTANPYPLAVIEIADHDADGYDGDDIAHALQLCAEETYEDLDRAGNGDGIYEPAYGESPIRGGCILRALPVTYENVAIMLSDFAYRCDDRNERDSSTWTGDVTHPLHCLVLDFPAGLEIEGHREETVFRSPVWQPNRDGQYLPAAVLDLYHREHRIALRNLVLDGRKHEQVSPNWSDASTWHHMGFRVATNEFAREILGDGIGNEGSLYGLGPPVTPYHVCDYETCAEETGTHIGDGDGRCEAGEQCREIDSAQGGNDDQVCDTDYFPDAVACVTALDNQNGCIHNVEFRNFFSTGAKFTNASHWIVEDSEFHDMGCLNRGFGFDCPYVVAPDFPPPPHVTFPDYKSDGYGLDVNDYTAYFQVRRNEVYRTSKYGMGFKNGAAFGCNGQATEHQIYGNQLHDLGFIGIYSYGAVGTRMFQNWIDGTTVFQEPASWNSSNESFGVRLGGFCSGNNEFFSNHITNMAGPAIGWSGESRLVECTARNGCGPPAERLAGDRIDNNRIDGTCLEKKSAPPASPTQEDVNQKFGSIHTGTGAGGDLFLTANTLTDSECRFVVSAFGARSGVDPLNLRISGGSYESGPNAAPDGFFYSGALHAHGAGRTIVVDGDTRIVNTAPTAVPKASAGYGATIVIDDDTTDPFEEGAYLHGVVGGSPLGTILECRHPPDPRSPPVECFE